VTVFRKSVSWSKFALALKCPLQLQKTLDKEYSHRYGVKTAPAAQGKLVQKVFELYFNGDLNLDPRGRRVQVLYNILEKVLKSKWAVGEELETFCSIEGFLDEVKSQLAGGYELFSSMGLLGYKIRSEVQMQVQFKGFPMFGMLDFLVFHPQGKILLDGKGNKEDTADPNQILYYGLELHAAGETIVDSGFLYWRRNFVRVPASPRALHHFVNGDFARGRKIFERLRVGVDMLEANPSSSNCNHCFWKSTCTESYYRKDAVEVFKGVENVGFGEE